MGGARTKCSNCVELHTSAVGFGNEPYEGNAQSEETGANEGATSPVSRQQERTGGNPRCREVLTTRPERWSRCTQHTGAGKTLAETL